MQVHTGNITYLEQTPKIVYEVVNNAIQHHQVPGPHHKVYGPQHLAFKILEDHNNVLMYDLIDGNYVTRNVLDIPQYYEAFKPHLMHRSRIEANSRTLTHPVHQAVSSLPPPRHEIHQIHQAVSSLPAPRHGIQQSNHGLVHQESLQPSSQRHEHTLLSPELIHFIQNSTLREHATTPHNFYMAIKGYVDGYNHVKAELETLKHIKQDVEERLNSANTSLGEKDHKHTEVVREKELLAKQNVHISHQIAALQQKNHTLEKIIKNLKIELEATKGLYVTTSPPSSVSAKDELHHSSINVSSSPTLSRYWFNDGLNSNLTSIDH